MGGIKDRNVGARQELSLLVGIPVHRVVDEVRTDSAVVEQCVGLAGRTVACDGFSLTLRVDQEVKNLALGLLYAFLEASVVVQPVHAGSVLCLQHLGHSLSGRRATIRVSGEDSQRAAVGAKLRDVEDGQ